MSLHILTASEWLLAAVAALYKHFSALGPGLLLLNIALTLLVVGLAFAAQLLLRQGLRVIARRTPGPSTAEKTVRTSRALRVCMMLSRLAVGFVALWAIAGLWGLDLMAFLSHGAAQQLLRTGARVMVIVVVAVLAFEISAFIIGKLLSDLADGATDFRRAAQLQTVSPIISGLAQTVIIVMASLMLMSEVGVKIGPLLAGAGVIGVAVGFGAQSLVKDFLTGIFLIVEDIVSVGDIIQIGGFGGLVEAMTLRTIRLRDFDGTLHIFPYSEAQVIHNMTKSFSCYVFELLVSYESDIDKAVDVMRDTGEDLAKDPDFADKILEPIEVVGVDGLADSGIRLKARIKTRPIEQWGVGREYNRRIKLAFDRAGIEIPYPHMKLVVSRGAA